MRACVRVCAAVAAAVVVIISVGVVVGARVGACVEDVVGVGARVGACVKDGVGPSFCPKGWAIGAFAILGSVACTCTNELPGGAFEEAFTTGSRYKVLGTALSMGGVP